jgi:hypothetical protein
MQLNKYTDSRGKRAALVAVSLACNPMAISTYLTTRTKRPIDIGLPWISLGAIRFSPAILRSEMEVFEYGCGGSTVFFARRCQKVVAVEDSAEWAALVRDRLDGTSNAEIIFHSTDKAETTDNAEFKRSAYLHAIDVYHPDVVLIDGGDEWTLKEKRRSICVEPMMKRGGIILVDDSWAYSELHAQNRAKRVMTFWVVGPCRSGVMSTDVYCY